MPTTKSSYRAISEYSNTTVRSIDSQTDNRSTTASRSRGRSVVLYNTEVFRHDRVNGTITLRHDGHRTATTKRRINECLRASDWPWRVYQEDFEWYIRDQRTGETVPFDDPHTIDL